MTDEQIEQLAQRVAKLIINNLHEGLITEWQPDEEEDLLAELARCMTLLDKYLKSEQYEKCEIIKSLDCILIYILKDGEIFMWKSFNSNMPISIEYNINF